MNFPGRPHHERLFTRRDFLARAGAGFGALALTYLLEREAFAIELRASFDQLLDRGRPFLHQRPHRRPVAQRISAVKHAGVVNLDGLTPKLHRAHAGKELRSSAAGARPSRTDR